MFKTRFLSIAVLIAFLSGCATKTPASCDGLQRRPINAPALTGVVYKSCGAGVA